MITWRNKSVHSLAQNEPHQADWKILEHDKQWMKDNFRGMEFNRLFSDFERGGAPTFKETASFIRATQIAVEHIDGYYLERLNAEVYLKSFLRSYMKPFPLERQKKIAQSIWGQDISLRKKKVISFLVNNGLSSSQKYRYSFTVPDDVLDDLAELTPASLLNQYIA
jgi:hypothetical protein